ncbi:O-methylsterigmatocystin oxidoreductase [Mycena sanguinolenta]|uniref:O-methylsterigmatocystin oxidoreductase n=1 Tax=Mycena sanguinolenta TaxID=230812 RepID=A0A8H6XTC2_9AGAR|nr:O-methylsterigmatocystin oxidoreductase [Mycena sanguinolenta]
MNYSSLALLTSTVVLLKLFQKYFNSWHRRHLPFPPGPPSYPFIGNFRDLPTKLPWLTYAKWGMQYGSDVVHASALGQHIVVVNSIKAVVELFEKRSHIHSDRPVITMIELLAAAVIMATLYGYEVRPSNDHFVALSENAVNKFSESVFPGAAAVNTFPILRYLPSWMPGAGFQRFAAESRQSAKEMREVPFDFAKRNMVASNVLITPVFVHCCFQHDGVDSKSIVARLLEANQARGRVDEIAIQEVAAVAYAAGSDTTVSALASFFLAMALHPDVQKKAQTEIDTVVGIHQLPEFKDRPSLPYVEALYREVMRWKPVLPLGLAHASSADDIYNGYFIPKGTTVFGNIWAMTRDESIYPDPERFNPDRFFTADRKLNDDDTILAFGFGRRICVGRHTADASVWGTIVSVLSTFNIAKAKDATGEDIDIDPKYSDAIVSHPLPFPCSIIPRSETAKSLVQATTMETHD